MDMNRLLFNQSGLLLEISHDGIFSFNVNGAVVELSVNEANKLAGAVIRETNESPELLAAISDAARSTTLRELIKGIHPKFDEKSSHKNRILNEAIIENVKATEKALKAHSRMKRRYGNRYDPTG